MSVFDFVLRSRTARNSTSRFIGCAEFRGKQGPGVSRCVPRRWWMRQEVGHEALCEQVQIRPRAAALPTYAARLSTRRQFAGKGPMNCALPPPRNASHQASRRFARSRQPPSPASVQRSCPPGLRRASLGDSVHQPCVLREEFDEPDFDGNDNVIDDHGGSCAGPKTGEEKSPLM